MGPCDESQDYMLQLIEYWSSEAWSSKDGHFDYGAGLPHLDTPVLSVIGRGDKLMAHWDGARNWFDALDLPNGECWLTERADESSRWQPDHMSLVTDPRSKPVWQRIERWLNSAVSCPSFPK